MPKFSQTLFSLARKTKKAAAFLSRHLVAVNLIIFVAAVLLSFSYVVLVNFSTTNGYRTRELETSINRLELDNQAMQVKIAEIRSMENVAAKVPMLGMVKAETPRYISGYPSTVSMNR